MIPKKFSMKVAATFLPALVAGGAIAVSVATGAHAKHAIAPVALDAANISALHSSATALSALPASTPAPSPDLAPAAGAVHSLGDGKASAWTHAGQVCWSTTSAAGCLADSQQTQIAVDPVISDPDQIRAGLPARVSGIAVDGVTKVIVTLHDGTELSATPTNNWYEVDLPGSDTPWSVASVQAVMANGQSVTAGTFNAKEPTIN